MIPRIPAFVALVLVAACTRARSEAARPVASSDASALVIQGSDLVGDVLDALRQRVQNMTVTYPVNGCPRIAFRGHRTSGNPSVYVDGTLIGDTCVLTQISSNDIDRVEVYRSGGASRAGIPGNPNGVILVYRIRS